MTDICKMPSLASGTAIRATKPVVAATPTPPRASFARDTFTPSAFNGIPARSQPTQPAVSSEEPMAKIYAAAIAASTTSEDARVLATAAASWAKESKKKGEPAENAAALDRVSHQGFRRAADLAKNTGELRAVIQAADAAGRRDAGRYATNKLPAMAKSEAAAAVVDQAAARTQAARGFSAANKAAFIALRANDLPEAARLFQAAAASTQDFDQATSVMRAAGEAYREAKERGELDADWQPLVGASLDGMHKAEKLITNDGQALEIALYLHDTGSDGLSNYYAQLAIKLNQSRPRIAENSDTRGVQSMLDSGMDAVRSNGELVGYYFEKAADLAKTPDVAREVAHAAMIAAVGVRAEASGKPDAAQRVMEARVKKLEAAADYATRRANSF